MSDSLPPNSPSSHSTPHSSRYGPRRFERGNGVHMNCHAAIEVDTDESGQSWVSRLRRDGPLVPREMGIYGFEPYIQKSPQAVRVALTTAAAGPLGGDNYQLDIRVGAGATLFLREVSASLILPGAHGAESRWVNNVVLEEGATLVWVPEPFIAARGCRHFHDVQIEMADSARLFYREELVLGRNGEAPGNLVSRLSVRSPDGRAITQQQFDIGPRAIGYASPAVVDKHRGVGSIVVVSPEGGLPTKAAMFGPFTGLFPISENVTQINAVADDAVELKKRLNTALTPLGPPWSSPNSEEWSAMPG